MDNLFSGEDKLVTACTYKITHNSCHGYKCEASVFRITYKYKQRTIYVVMCLHARGYVCARVCTCLLSMCTCTGVFTHVCPRVRALMFVSVAMFACVYMSVHVYLVSVCLCLFVDVFPYTRTRVCISVYHTESGNSLFRQYTRYRDIPTQTDTLPHLSCPRSIQFKRARPRRTLQSMNIC